MKSNALNLPVVVAAALLLVTESAVSDAVSPEAGRASPILTIGGMEKSNIYLQSLDVQAEVTGGVASTRYTMVVKNKTGRVVEGVLIFSLPAGRGVTYYALDIDGKMREAVPVEKAWGTAVFNAIVSRRVDPGLLEILDNGNFRMRIYPISPHGVRTVAIGYEEELSREGDSLRYRVSVAYPDSLENFSVKATVWKSGRKPTAPDSGAGFRFNKAGESYVASFARKNYRPARELSFGLPAPVDTPRVVMQPAEGSYYFLASAAPKPETRKKRWGDELAIIWDVSLSGSRRDIERELEALDIVFAEKKNADVYLYYLNNTLTKMIHKNTANGEHKVIDGNWDELRNILKRAVFDGGTDFSKIRLKAVAGDEILFFSDGVSTLGDADFIKDRAVNVKRPIHCVVSSAQADYGAMKLIADKTRGKFVNINALSSEELKKELSSEALQFLGTEHGEAVREVYPGIATPVRGDNFSVAGISDTSDAELTLLFGFGNRVEKRIKVRLDAKKADGQAKAHKLWAQKKIAELDLAYDKNLAELAEIGRRFGIVTRNTSLIVLETVEDYIRYNITPPAAETGLYAEYQRRLKEQERRQSGKLPPSQSSVQTPPQNNAPASSKSNVQAPPQNNAPPVSSQSNARPAANTARKSTAFEAAEVMGYLDNPTPVYIIDVDDPNADPLILDRSFRDNIKEMGLEILGPDRMPADCRGSGKSYLYNLTGNTAEDYQLYLKRREGNASSPEFYFDFAEWFYTRGDKKIALRVLTSIAELVGRDVAQHRMLAYRLKEYGEYAQEAFICKTIIMRRPSEAQSYRDYALALADNGDAQTALDSLHSLLARTNAYYRYHEMEDVLVMEINRLIAKNANLNKSKIDEKLIGGVPVDIRVVINRNTYNSGVDFHIVDPNNEICDYRRRETKIGGRVSGYWPMQFVLKNAIKGKYRIDAYYSGNRVGESTTVMAEIYTKYADKTERRRVVCLLISNTMTGDCKLTEMAAFEF